MNYKMKGFIDPYGLGFVIMIISGLYFQAQPTRLERLNQQQQQVESAAVQSIQDKEVSHAATE